MARAALCLVLFLGGCVSPCPHVYDWGAKLAHPTMTPDEIATHVDARVRAISEGATSRLGDTTSPDLLY